MRAQALNNNSRCKSAPGVQSPVCAHPNRKLAGSTGTGGGGGSTSVYSASEHAQRVNDVKSRVNMRGLKA